MPVKNYFPRFHKLKSGAYSYMWTDKCEKLLPKHYKERCLEYMMREPTPVHWIPDTRKYTVDEYGTRLPVQNHPIRVKYPVQCNYGLWGGEGIVQCWTKYIRSQKMEDVMSTRIAKFHVPYLVNRTLYSEILDKWLTIPCTNRAMDQIDEAFGLDYYILKTHERDLNSKLAMDLRRKMLIRLCRDADKAVLPQKRQKVFDRYKEFMIPIEEAEWVGLSISQALTKAERERAEIQLPPLKELIEKQFRKELEDFDSAETKKEEENQDKSVLDFNQVPEEQKTETRA